MTNYTKTTDFAAKDSLPSGDSGKIIRGAEFGTEFDNIETAVNSKSNKENPSFTGNITVTGTVDGRDIAADGTKLDTIETSADVTDTANVTAAGAVMDSELTDITAVKALNQGVATTDSPTFAAVTSTGNVTVGGTVDGRDVAADGTKLDGIEAGATADQTPAQIKTAYESNADTNAFTDADHTKLDGIEASADVTDTTNVTAAGAVMDSELTDIAAVKALNQGVATTDSPTFSGATVNGTVEFDGLSGTGAVTVTDILDQDNMSSNSATALATQQSIKAYVDSQVATSDTLAEVLANGNTTGGTDVAFGDNDKALFGAGSDLQVYHDGSNSYINDDGNGDLFVRSTNGDGVYIYAGGTGSSSKRIFANSTGSVDLYYGSTARLATTSTGIDVTGTVTADGLTVDGSSAGRVTSAEFKNNANSGGTEVAITLANQGGTSNADVNLVANRVGSNFGSDFYIETSDGVDGTNRKRLNVGENGDISFYEDTGTTAKLFWDASTESLMLNASTRAGTEILTVNGTVTTGGGTASAPALAFRADSNTGMFRPASQSLGFSTNGSEAMRIDSNQNVLVGTTDDSPFNNSAGSAADNGLALKENGQLQVAAYKDTANSGAVVYFNRTGTDGNSIDFRKNGNTVGSIGTAGSRVYISGPSASLHSGLIFTDNGSHGIIAPSTNAGAIANGTTDLGYSGGRFKDLHLSGAVKGGNGSASAPTFSFGNTTTMGMYRGANHQLAFSTNSAERMRLDGSGNLLIGTTSSNVANQTGTTQGVRIAGAQNIQVASTGVAAYFNKLSTDGTIVEFRKSGTTVGSIGAFGGDLYIGTNDSGLRFEYAGVNAIIPFDVNSSAISNAATDLGHEDARFKDFYLSGGLRGDTTFKNNAGTTEYARFDSSGNLLVGTTSPTAGITATSGNSFVYRPAAELTVARQGSGTTSPVAIFNQTGDDGQILDLRKDGTTVGSIGTYVNLPFIGKSDVNLLFDPAGPHMIPRGTNGGARDAAINLGSSSNRFEDLYLSGGVQFGTADAAAELLDDYEEGTWNPAASTAQGFTLGTPTGANGTYTKVGRLVSLKGGFTSLDSTDVIAVGDRFEVAGIPFNASGSLTAATASAGSCFIYNSFGGGALATGTVTHSGTDLIVMINSVIGSPTFSNDLNIGITYEAA